MPAKSIMFQGTGSDVGKSLLVAGLCRLLARRGYKVVPFKAQNMSNNAAVADDGGEIGRAQWLQALAAGMSSSFHMNPVLLKPQSDKTSQLIVRGKLMATMGAKEYQGYRKSLLATVLESYHHLAKDADFVLVEGAGSPAEINLRENDIANMGFARAANCPVVLVGDIERGGVIASLVGTYAVLENADLEMIRGFIVNKFRGDASLFASGAQEIVKRTGWENLGLVPYFSSLAKLPKEDSVGLGSRHGTTGDKIIPTNITVLKTPHIANFDDIDPLMNDPNIKLSWCEAGDAISVDADIVILAGSKSTISDLQFIKAQGWDVDMQAHLRRGRRIIGLCGGYQMLGRSLSDPHGVEGCPATVEGLGFLDVDTIFTSQKIVSKWQGKCGDFEVSGYEIHVGETKGGDCLRPVFHGIKPEGASSQDGLVWGSYIHGVFANDGFRSWLLGVNSSYNYRQDMAAIMDSWADMLEENIIIDKLLQLAGQ